MSAAKLTWSILRYGFVVAVCALYAKVLIVLVQCWRQDILLISVLISGTASLLLLLATGVIIRPPWRDQLARQYGARYRRFVTVLAVAACCQATAIAALILGRIALSAQLWTSTGQSVLLLSDSIYLLLAALLTLVGWRLLAEASRAPRAEKVGSGLPVLQRFWLANWHAGLWAVLPVVSAAVLAWYGPPLVWYKMGRPPLEADNGFPSNPAAPLACSEDADSIWLLNGKPNVHRGDEPEGMSARGDVIVSVTYVGVSGSHRHVFPKVLGNPYGYWEVPLDGWVHVRVQADLASGPFDGTYCFFVRDDNPVYLVLEFIGSTPRVLLYHEGSGKPDLIAQADR